MYVITTIFCDDFFPYCVAVIMHYFCDPDIAQPYTTWSTTLWSNIRFFFRMNGNLWYAHQMVSQIVFSRILNCLLLLFFSGFFLLFQYKYMVILTFLVYSDSQTNLSFEEIKTSSKVVKNQFGICKNKISKTFWWADHKSSLTKGSRVYVLF